MSSRFFTSCRTATAALATTLGACMFLIGGAGPARAADGEPGCRPEMAHLRWPAWTLPVQKASLGKDEARITFVGHSTFIIESASGTRAATDYNDFVRARETPDIATMNKAHSTHFSRNPEPGIKQLLPGWTPNGEAARHDVTVADMRVRNVATNIRDYSGRTDFDGNSMFVFEIGDLCIAHLGHLHHPLEPGHLRALGRVDVVLVPVDGSYTLDMEGMMDVLKSLQARVMVPMHFFGPSTLNRFINRSRELWPVEIQTEPVLKISKDTLPARPTVIVLPGN
jgi:L-ascorbate metabolism protein UlaG (beta-lactamase superfamily)